VVDGGRLCQERGGRCGQRGGGPERILPGPSLPESITTRHQPRTLKEIRVDRTTFDALMLRVARQTTRRAALATLLGGALLLHRPASSDATKEAPRGNQATTASLKPISLRIDNTAGKRDAGVIHQESRPFSCCGVINQDATVPRGQRVLFHSSSPSASVWIANKYWIEILNPSLARPNASAAVRGQPTPSDFCCRQRGRTVKSRREMKIGDTISFRMDGHDFRMTRNRDTNYKEFTLMLPAGF